MEKKSVTNELARLLNEEIKASRDKQKPSIFSRIYPAMDYGKNNPPKDSTPCTMPEIDHGKEEVPVKDASKDKADEQLTPFATRVFKTLTDSTASWFPPTSASVPDNEEEEDAAEAKLATADESVGRRKFLRGLQAKRAKSAGHD